jgi:hypothetical protein
MNPFICTITRRNHRSVCSWTIRKIRLIAFTSLLMAGVQHGSAAETASAVITPTSLGGGDFDYSIKLTDTGTTDLGTFWFSWIPGQDYLPVSPISEISPTGWHVGTISHGGSSDGYAIQWVASSDLLTPGNSLTFSFESTATPAQIAGDSPFYPTTPVGTAFVYSGAPFSDGGDRLVATVETPEPSTFALSFLALAAMGGLVFLRKSGAMVDSGAV